MHPFPLPSRPYTRLALLLLLLLAASPAWADKKRVVTTFTVLADMAQNVAGDHATVESITRPGAEIHGYEPTPGDILKAQKADLVLWNGLNLERWFEKFFRNLRNVPNAVLTEGIPPIGITEGPYTGKPNPHAWMSLKNAAIYVDNIRKALIRIDPLNEAAYNANAAAYIAQFKAIEERAKAALEKIPENQRWLVTSEGAFPYFAESLGLKQLFLWAINADQQGTPRQVQKAIDAVRTNKIPVVFSECTVSDKPMRQVAKETGARYGGILYVDSLSEPQGPVPSYLRLLEYDVETVVQGLLQK